MELLVQSTSHLPIIMEATDKYLRDHPVYVNQTLEGLIAHVTLHLTNPTATTRLLGSAAATTTVSGTAAVKAVESSMETMTEMMIAMMTRMERMEKKITSGKKVTPGIPATITPGQAPKPGTKYCFVHGLNPTHEGTQCRVMIGDPTYSINHKNATGPALIEGKQGRA